MLPSQWHLNICLEHFLVKCISEERYMGIYMACQKVTRKLKPVVFLCKLIFVVF